MYKETKIVKIDSRGTIKIPNFIKVNPGEKLYFRKDFYDEEKIMIVNSENLRKIWDIIQEMKKAGKIPYKQSNSIIRYIFPHTYDSTCGDDQRIKIPLPVKHKEFICEEVNTKIKKFILTPIEK